MLLSLQKSILLLLFTLLICCGIYPLALWTIGQTFFPFQANGSILRDANNKPIGSLLIAQAFTKDEYFSPRPSAAAYNAAASASSSLAASNNALRHRVASALGPIARYRNNGKLVGHDIETWFQQDKFQGQRHIVAIWATRHPALAQRWVSADPARMAFVAAWAKAHPSSSQPVAFFQQYAAANPGKFPGTSADIQAIFFDMWQTDHPDVELEPVPADMVTTSASGLDPHITLQAAQYQLERVAAKWASQLKRDPAAIREEISQLLNEKATAPLAGFVGEKIINVLEINLALHKKYDSVK